MPGPLLGKPRSPIRGDETIGDGELGFSQPRLDTTADHVQRPRSHAFDVLGQIQGLPNQGVAGYGPVRFPQLLQSQRRRKSAGVADLQAVREQHDLHTAVVRVVAMHHRVHDRFGQHLRRNFICPGRPCALRPRTDGPIDLGEHEIHRLIDEVERGALVDLIRRNRLGDLRSMETSAPDVGGEEKALRRLPEQQDRGVRRPALVQQVQMLQQLRTRCPLWERELSDQARGADELRHALVVEVIQCRPDARGGVERLPANQLLALQVLDQRRVEPGHKLPVVLKRFRINPA